ncbi:molybdopterin dehydrogenase FAD-binding protein [Desulfovibrio sp. X2]|uniref:FAD binding domain-containing protein n=1 Tax=Desulfovibrio sp. X2 TaxID=941449 RepID=UPI000358B55A|nr:xanthine dehydrogenase family protein subunit M [Desulfovibrio sp. X2]EPR41613.1 molybdopterin dehydrogenase FAD-binding protein [Desulfovibrio sp. X2]
MATIRDVMPEFALYRPTGAADAVGLLDKYGADAWAMAGGQDSLDWFKDRIKRPKVVVDLSMVDELRGIRPLEGGLEIGALTTLSEVERHPQVRAKFSLLAQAAGAAASPQIRNRGTLGGNASQDSRCWYYRSGFDCYRAGGHTCYADTPVGQNREHAVFGAGRCVTVNPSDTAPALAALDARMVIRSVTGTREVAAVDYFVGPEIDITRLTVLGPGDLLTAVRIPGTWAGADFHFEKVRDRQVWDFALVNIAAAFLPAVGGGAVGDARIVLNGVAPRPLRLSRVEDFLRGKARDAATAETAGAMAAQGAEPLQHNGYKVALARNLVARAVLGTGRGHGGGKEAA